MGNFFSSWRRRTGGVTLLMATLLVAGWIRSLVVCDMAAFSYGTHSLVYWVSADGYVTFGHSLAKQPGYFQSYWFTDTHQNFETAMSAFRWIGRFVGLGIGVYEDPVNIEHNVVVTAPCWSFVVPLTLLSAFLILWPSKHRRA